MACARSMSTIRRPLVLRLVAGLGAGLYTAVAVAGLGAHSKPREAFNWMLLAFAISQFLELQLIPHLSMNGVYLFFIATYVVTLPFVRFIPKTSAPEAPLPEASSENAETSPSGLGWHWRDRDRLHQYWRLLVEYRIGGRSGRAGWRLVSSGHCLECLAVFLGLLRRDVDPKTFRPRPTAAIYFLPYGHRGRTIGGRHHRGAVRIQRCHVQFPVDFHRCLSDGGRICR